MQRIKIPLLAICLVLATTRAALAFTAPSAGDMWYTMYEVFYDRLVAGPLVGLLTGGVLAWGLAAAIRGSFATFVLCTCTAGVLFKLEDVVTGFGIIC